MQVVEENFGFFGTLFQFCDQLYCFHISFNSSAQDFPPKAEKLKGNHSNNCSRKVWQKHFFSTLLASQKVQTPIAPNVQRKMILARRSSPTPSARHICRTRIKTLTRPAATLSHPMGARPPIGSLLGSTAAPAVGFDALVEPTSARPMFPAGALETAPVAGALPPTVQRKMILARRSSPAPSARHICRTKTKIKFQPRRGGIFGGEIFNAKTQRREGARNFCFALIASWRLCVNSFTDDSVAADFAAFASFARPVALAFCRSRGDETHFNLGPAIADGGFSIRDSSRRPLQFFTTSAGHFRPAGAAGNGRNPDAVSPPRRCIAREPDTAAG